LLLKTTTIAKFITIIYFATCFRRLNYFDNNITTRYIFFE